MKSRITVVGAAIVKEGKLLALRRADGNDEVIHKFEFVGGKVEEGETPEEALKRECIEELSLEVEVGDLLNTIEYDYPNTSVCLSVYFVKPLSDYKLKVHEEERWFDCAKLDTADWDPADKAFLNTLKTGYSKTLTASGEEDFKTVGALASEIMRETYEHISPDGLIDYILGAYLTPEKIQKSVSENGYTFKILYLNGEAAGFYSYCPAKNYRGDFSEGTYVSKLYIKKFARGKRFASKIFASLTRPLYLTVKRDNVHAINVYKHCGFKILENVKTDLGNGYFSDDFLMVLGK